MLHSGLLLVCNTTPSPHHKRLYKQTAIQPGYDAPCCLPCREMNSDGEDELEYRTEVFLPQKFLAVESANVCELYSFDIQDNISSISFSSLIEFLFCFGKTMEKRKMYISHNEITVYTVSLLSDISTAILAP